MMSRPFSHQEESGSTSISIITLSHYKDEVVNSTDILMKITPAGWLSIISQNEEMVTGKLLCNGQTVLHPTALWIGAC